MQTAEAATPLHSMLIINKEDFFSLPLSADMVKDSLQVETGLNFLSNIWSIWAYIKIHSWRELERSGLRESRIDLLAEVSP